MRRDIAEYLINSLGQGLVSMGEGYLAKKQYSDWQNKYLPGGKPVKKGTPYQDADEYTLDESAMAELIAGLGNNRHAQTYLSAAQGALGQAQRQREEERAAAEEARRRQEAEALKQEQQRAGLMKSYIDLYGMTGHTIDPRAIPQAARALQGLEDPRLTMQRPNPWGGAEVPQSQQIPMMGAAGAPEAPGMDRILRAATPVVEDPVFIPAPQQPQKMDVSERLFTDKAGNLFQVAHDPYGQPALIGVGHNMEPQGQIKPYVEPKTGGGPREPQIKLSDLRALADVDDRRLQQGVKSTALTKKREKITGIRVVRDADGKEVQRRVGPGYPPQSELTRVMFDPEVSPDEIRTFNQKYGPTLIYDPAKEPAVQLMPGVKSREQALEEWDQEYQQNRASHISDTRRLQEYETLLSGQPRY